MLYLRIYLHQEYVRNKRKNICPKHARTSPIHVLRIPKAIDSKNYPDSTCVYFTEDDQLVISKVSPCALLRARRKKAVAIVSHRLAAFGKFDTVTWSRARLAAGARYLADDETVLGHNGTLSCTSPYREPNPFRRATEFIPYRWPNSFRTVKEYRNILIIMKFE